jgi:hypothetical protein
MIGEEPMIRMLCRNADLDSAKAFMSSPDAAKAGDGHYWFVSDAGENP